MTTGIPILLACVLTATGAPAQIATGARPNTPAPAAKLSLSSEAGRGGEEAIVGVRLEQLPRDRQVLGFRFTFEYPTALLKFVEARPTVRRERLSVAAAQREIDWKTSHVSVTVTSPTPITRREPVELVFGVKDVSTAQDAEIVPRSASLQTGAGEIDGLRLQRGVIRIAAPSSLPACFFYMH